MNFTASEHGRVVDAIHNGIFSEGSLRLLKAMTVHGKASELMTDVVSVEQSHSKSKKDAIYKLLVKLELLASHTQIAACVLMARLWPYASDLFLHDVCDSIDLWISECNSDELTSQLNVQALSVQDSGLRRHYEGWLKRQ